MDIDNIDNIPMINYTYYLSIWKITTLIGKKKVNHRQMENSYHSHVSLLADRTRQRPHHNVEWTGWLLKLLGHQPVNIQLVATLILLVTVCYSPISLITVPPLSSNMVGKSLISFDDFPMFNLPRIEDFLMFNSTLILGRVPISTP